MKRVLLVLFLLLVLVGCNPSTKTEYSIDIVPASNTIGLNQDFIDPGVYLVSNQSSDKIEIPIVTNNINNQELGEYIVIYQLEKDGIIYTANRVIKVIDTIIPTATLQPGIDTIRVGETHIDTGVNATDNIDEELDIEVISTVDTTTVGNYTITYIITDDYYNQRTIIRYVYVIE